MPDQTCSLPPRDQRTLLEVAIAAIEHRLRSGSGLKIVPGRYSTELQFPRATFVTLRRDGELRGCRGSLRPVESLIVNVARNAHASAFYDERFEPISPGELEALHIHISILAPAETIPFESEQDLLDRIRPGVDGLILRAEEHQGVFLPSVWERLADVEVFWIHLKRKAGLPDDFWSPSLRVERFVTESIEGHVANVRRDADPGSLPD